MQDEVKQRVPQGLVSKEGRVCRCSSESPGTCKTLRSSGGHSRAVDGQKPEHFPPFPGQLRFWNPDDLNASPGASLPTPDWIEEKLQEVCEHLGIARDGHLNRKKLISICEQYGLRTAAGEVSGHVWTHSQQRGCRGFSLTPTKSGLKPKVQGLLYRSLLESPGSWLSSEFFGVEPSALGGCCSGRQLPALLTPQRACRLLQSQSKLEFKNIAWIPSVSP